MIDQPFPVASALRLPVEPYRVEGHHFGARVRSRIILWARHLGDDVLLPPSTPIKAAADGRVVWAEMRLGTAEHHNWGGIVVIGHQHQESGDTFFTLYGHLTQLSVKRGDTVTAGQTVGVVAPGSSPDNGWWKKPHLHFGVYIGPWMNQILPGYARLFEGRTKFRWWRDPLAFMKEYNETVKDTHGS